MHQKQLQVAIPVQIACQPMHLMQLHVAVPVDYMPTNALDAVTCSNTCTDCMTTNALDAVTHSCTCTDYMTTNALDAVTCSAKYLYRLYMTTNTLDAVNYSAQYMYKFIHDNQCSRSSTCRICIHQQMLQISHYLYGLH